MKIPLYILGFLKRFGPQHGYQIKKNIAENVADFAHIKLPAVYYHLEQMGKKGLICFVKNKEGNRPERRVYSLASAGEKELRKLLDLFLKKEYQAEFDLDAVLFFIEFLQDREHIVDGLCSHRTMVKKILRQLDMHETEVSAHLMGESKSITTLLFNHHKYHYRAEFDWLNESIAAIKEIKNERNKKHHGNDLERG